MVPRMALCAWLLISGAVLAQSSASPLQEASGTSGIAPSADANMITIPAGTKIPLSLKQAISTKNAREGDAVYAETAFPYVIDNRMVVPAGSYIQGKISHVERGGRLKGRAEILIHFTSLVYPSGYTVMLPGSVENTPGAEKNSLKDSEGTIQQDKDTGKKIEDAAKGGVYGGRGDGNWLGVTKTRQRRQARRGDVNRNGDSALYRSGYKPNRGRQGDSLNDSRSQVVSQPDLSEPHPILQPKHSAGLWVVKSSSRGPGRSASSYPMRRDL